MGKPLVVVGDDDPAALEAIVSSFRDHNCETYPAQTTSAFKQININLSKRDRIPDLEVLDLQFGRDCPPEYTEKLALECRAMYKQPIKIVAYSGLPESELIPIKRRGVFDDVISKDERAETLVAGLIAQSGEKFLEALNKQRDDSYNILIIQGSLLQAEVLAKEARAQRCNVYSVCDYDGVALSSSEMKEQDIPCDAIITGLNLPGHSTIDVLEAVRIAQIGCHRDSVPVFVYSEDGKAIHDLRAAGVIQNGYAKENTEPKELIEAIRRRLYRLKKLS